VRARANVAAIVHEMTEAGDAEGAQEYVDSRSGVAFAGACLGGASVAASNMASTRGLKRVGVALHELLERGLLVTDVHHDNVGFVHRMGWKRQARVITDPGLFVRLDPRIELPEIEEL
jgi:hypothetical protein